MAVTWRHEFAHSSHGGEMMWQRDEGSTKGNGDEQDSSDIDPSIFAFLKHRLNQTAATEHPQQDPIPLNEQSLRVLHLLI